MAASDLNGQLSTVNEITAHTLIVPWPRQLMSQTDNSVPGTVGGSNTVVIVRAIISFCIEPPPPPRQEEQKARGCWVRLYEEGSQLNSNIKTAQCCWQRSCKVLLPDTTCGVHVRHGSGDRRRWVTCTPGHSTIRQQRSCPVSGKDQHV